MRVRPSCQTAWTFLGADHARPRDRGCHDLHVVYQTSPPHRFIGDVEGSVGDEARQFDGTVGLRTDNARLEFARFSDPGGQESAARAPANAPDYREKSPGDRLVSPCSMAATAASSSSARMCLAAHNVKRRVVRATLDRSWECQGYFAACTINAAPSGRCSVLSLLAEAHRPARSARPTPEPYRWALCRSWVSRTCRSWTGPVRYRCSRWLGR